MLQEKKSKRGAWIALGCVALASAAVVWKKRAQN